MKDIPAQVGRIDPIFVSVKDAAAALGVSTWQMYQLVSGDDAVIDARRAGKRVLVSVEALREYAANLPSAGERSA